MKIKFLITISLFVLATCYLLLATSSLAQTFNSDHYQITWGNFNITSGKKSSTTYQLTDTVGQFAPGQYDSFGATGYTLKAGFQYIYTTLYYFSFQIDDLAIDLGTLTPGVGSSDINIITISTPSGQGYQILAHQNQPLTTLSGGSTLPDTTCDNGNCTQSNSEVWTQDTTYGFGFNAVGINNTATTAYFADSTYFRQFADYSQNEESQTIMSETAAAQDRQARITYKANISAQQPAGEYHNTITFTAIPIY